MACKSTKTIYPVGWVDGWVGGWVGEWMGNLENNATMWPYLAS